MGDPKRRRPAHTSEAVLFATPEREFRQQRARRSYLALIDAATEEFSRHTYDAVGTPDIAARADVSVGTFYRYFEDKHEIYIEVTRRMLAAAYSETLAGLNPAQFVGKARADTIATTIDLLFEHVLARPQLSRSFSEMSLRDPVTAELRRVFEATVIARLTTLITAIVPRAVVDDPQAMAYVLYGSAMQCAYDLAGHVGAPPVSASRVKRALAAFIERTLFGSR